MGISEKTHVPGLIVEIRFGWDSGDGRKQWFGEFTATDPVIGYAYASEKARNEVPGIIGDAMMRFRRGQEFSEG